MKKVIAVIMTCCILISSGCGKKEQEPVEDREFSDGIITLLLDSEFTETDNGYDYSLKKKGVEVNCSYYTREQLSQNGYGKMNLESFAAEVIAGEKVESLEKEADAWRFSYNRVIDGKTYVNTCVILESEDYLGIVTFSCLQDDLSILSGYIRNWSRNVHLGGKKQ